MRKYFVKTIALALMVGTVTMLNGFCFLELLFNIAPKPVQAAAIMSDTVDACGAEPTGESTQSNYSLTAEHDTSVLPCCVDGGHNVSVLVIPYGQELVHFPIAALLSKEPILPDTIQASLEYIIPITSPPQLAVVKTTNLRL